MNKTQALCSQKGPDGLNEADHRLAEIRESQRCKQLAVEMFLGDVWKTLGNTDDEGFWKGSVVVDPDQLSIVRHRIKTATQLYITKAIDEAREEFGWALRGILGTYEDWAAERMFNEESD